MPYRTMPPIEIPTALCHQEHEDCNGVLWECRKRADHYAGEHVWSRVTDDVRCTRWVERRSYTQPDPQKAIATRIYYQATPARCLRWRDHAGPCRW